MNKKKVQSNRFKTKIHIKKGDTVRIVSGDDKGMDGEVLEVFPKKYRAIVAEANIVKKHKKPTNDNPGGIIQEPASIHISNLMLIDSASGEPTRIGRKKVDGKTVRYSKKSGEII
jgi:large subunit ribosomal protein L24